MASTFQTLSHDEVVSLLSAPKEKVAYKVKQHSFTPLKNTGKQFCKSCGIVAGNSPLARWCIDKGCHYEDHPQFKSMRRRLTRDARFDFI